MAYITVVEDDASVRELILCTLRSAGFTVDAYERGEDFLEQYEKHKEPDVILLDIMLPGIDGFELVNAVIRRRGRSARPQQAIESGGLKMDVSAHTLYVDGEKTELTYKEFEILRYFMRNPGLVLTREMLLNEIWGIDTDIETRTVDMHIKTLRQKIGRRGEHIKTVRGVGYRFEV